MEKQAINPSPWLQAFGINHGIEVKGGDRVLFLSGQTSTSDDGVAMHAGDLAAQFKFAWENLVKALQEGNMTPSDIVRLNVYTTDVDGMMEQAEALFGLISASGCQPTSTLLGVARLYDPSILVELEATAIA